MNHSSHPWYNAPQPPPYHVAPPQGGAGSVASFGRRLSARVIDYTLVAILVFMFFVLVSLISEASLAGQEIADRYFDAWAMLFFFGAGPVMFFHDWLANAARGRTLGKALVRIRVVRADGGPLGQGRSAGRAAVFGLPQAVPCLGPIITLIDCFAALADPTTMLALHDRICQTKVIRD